MDATKEKSEDVQSQSSCDQEPSAANGYGWNGSGFGWQLDANAIDGIYEAEIPIRDINPQDAKLDESADSIFPIAERHHFKRLRKEHFLKGTLFEDPQFPATTKSLRYSPLDEIVPLDLKEMYESIVWLRPTEIVKLRDPSEVPRLFVNGHSRFDIIQGALASGWALAAMGNLTMHPHLIGKVVPDGQSFEEKYAGIFRFKFWQFGKWVEVVVDDRLPTKDGELTFVKSSVENEFWISLLEKAYAKLCGSYEAIENGKAYEVLQDLTGGLVEVYKIENMKNNAIKDSFTILLQDFERGSLITGAISHDKPDEQRKKKLMESYGLVEGHIYGFTSVKYVETSNEEEEIVPLLRLRHLWGNEVEWKHSWSDDDTANWDTVSKDIQEEIGFKADHDGEFWISHQDFETYFTHFDICHLAPESLDEEEMSKGGKWHESMIEGAWVAGVTAGGRKSLGKNPQYVFGLADREENEEYSKYTLIVSLMQKHGRAMRRIGAENLLIGFYIYYLINPWYFKPPFKDIFFNDLTVPLGSPPYFGRYCEVNCRFNFLPGAYCIIPCTYDAEQEGSFMLRIFTEEENKLIENDDVVCFDETDDQIRIRTITSEEQEKDKQAMEMFLKLAKRDSEINWLELKAILDSAMKEDTKGTGFSEGVCRSIVALSDDNHSGKLDYEEFKNLWIDIGNWRAVFKLQDKGNTRAISGYQLREALLSTGYHVNNHILIDLKHRYGNKDHKFSFELFILCALKVKAMIDLFDWKLDTTTKTANFTLDEWMERTLYS